MLNDLNILVTRPEPQGAILCEKIIALGGNALCFPTIQIISPNDPALLRKQITQLSKYDWLIFVSRPAVMYSLPVLHECWPIFPDKVKLAAIGEGTAAALLAAGFQSVTYPLTEWTSEGLLKLEDFQQIAGQRIALVSGEGGRETLAETLAARGAVIARWIAYQRILPIYNDIAYYIDLFRQQKINIIVCASGESLHNLIRIIGTTNQSLLFKIPLVVVSPRLVGLASEIGFKQIFLAANASHAAIIDAFYQIK
jgi:uroporphyrinogen-III synthase